MAKDVVAIEPITLPDLSRGKTLLLPAWLDTQLAALREDLQIVNGQFKNVLTLPAQMMLTHFQRVEIEKYQRYLNAKLLETPERSDKWEGRTLGSITKLLLVLGGDKRSDLAAEAKAEAYMAALDDVCCWAVEAAAHCWYRGACGNDDLGCPYDYRWPPDPATLRKLALRQFGSALFQIEAMQRLLDAREFVDCSRDLEIGRLAINGLFRTFGDDQTLKSLTFEQAIEIGRGSDPTLTRDLAA
jgi:hypothetical protein